MNWELLAIALAVVGVVCTVFVTVRRVRHWQREGAKLSDAAYTAPEANWIARFCRLACGKIFAFLFLGRIRIFNAKARKTKGRFLVVFNHQTERDALVMLRSLGMLRFRYMIDLSQVGGWRAALAAWTGAIPVDFDSNPGIAARKAIRCLQNEEGTSLVLFPQGKLVRNNDLKREDFHAGMLMIGKQAQKKSKEPFYILPGAIHYDRNPKTRTLLHKALNLITFGMFRFRHWFGETTSGATIVFGEPIPMESIADNLEAGMDVVYREIKTLSTQAEETDLQEAARPRRWFLRPICLLSRIYHGFFEHEIMTRASSVAFCAMMATVPLLALMVSVAVQFLPNLANGGKDQSVGIGNLTVGQFESTLKMIFPEEAYRVIHEQIIALQTQPRLLTISIGLAVTFWTASSLYVAIMDALNRIYGSQETRSFIFVRLTAMLMTIVQTVILISSMLVIVTWPQIQIAFGLDSTATHAIDLVKWGAIGFMIMLTYALWFRVGPASYQQRSLFTYGGFFGSLAFIVVCMGFRTYVQNFAAYEKTYGSLGGVMALLLWYWLSSLVLLLAAEINRVIELMRAERSSFRLASLPQKESV
ncbi:MAG: YihY family inner membrane protein [Candidatus Obscuribacterales bacterium]|nr:YihY family inner membrane protein [Candidatus Obscuribacterales bacterium]